MLKGQLIHPELIGALAACGHGDKILIADANYPLAQKTGDDCTLIYLGLCPGMPTVTQVLESLLSVANFEKAEVMLPEDGSTPAIFPEFTDRLGGMPLDGLSRGDFYTAAAADGVRIAIATGEKRLFANLLLTLGTA